MSPLIAATEALLRHAPVIPVLTVEGAGDAVPLATALVAGGLPLLEVTLRTEGALKAITAMAKQVPGAIVGAGTIRTADQAKAAVDAGATFLVSPGATPQVIAAKIVAVTKEDLVKVVRRMFASPPAVSVVGPSVGQHTPSYEDISRFTKTYWEQANLEMSTKKKTKF